MFITRFIRPSRIPTSTRQFTLTVAKRDGKPTVNESQASKPNASTNQGSSADTKGILGGHMYNVNNFDRWMLVWVKRYKTKAEVPEAVTFECILAARSKARIKVCNYMMGSFMLLFLYTVLVGKKRAASGDSLMKQNEEWHARLRAEGEAERKAAAAKAAAS